MPLMMVTEVTIGSVKNQRIGRISIVRENVDRFGTASLLSLQRLLQPVDFSIAVI